MCFSAASSFTAAGGLALLGGASLAAARKEDKILAAIPFMFAIQQACEGIQWLYLYSGSTSLFMAYAFLFFAFLLWPAYVPFTVFMLDKKERKLLSGFVFLGIVVAVYFLAMLLTQHLAIGRYDACIDYRINLPFRELMVPAYLIAIIGSLLVSSIRIFKWYGVAIGLLGIIAWLFFVMTFTSVWCFFAAIVSSMFFLYVRQKNKTAS